MAGTPLTLSLDLSTQQLKAVVVITSNLEVICTETVSFSKTSSITKEYPVVKDGYYTRTEEGYKSTYQDDLGEMVTSVRRTTNVAPVGMWLLAIDELMQQLSNTLQKVGRSLSEIGKITGCAQQHGIVLWNCEPVLQNKATLREIYEPQLVFPEVHIWSDSSTSPECAVLADKLREQHFPNHTWSDRTQREFYGHFVAKVRTGSCIVERFALAQLYKRICDPKTASTMESTQKVSLISSFVATVLSGKLFPMELSDASGTNLLNISSMTWDTKMTSIAGIPVDWLRPNPVSILDYSQPISEYFCTKYGFSKSCTIHPFTGDNPATLIAMDNDFDSGKVCMSLGTSDTVFFGTTKLPTFSGDFFTEFPLSSSATVSVSHARVLEGHTMIHVHSTKETPRYMQIYVFKNGSLVRERLRDYLIEHQDVASRVLGHPGPYNDPWELFNAALRYPEYSGEWLLWYPNVEITPICKGLYWFRIVRTFIKEYDSVEDNDDVEESVEFTSQAIEDEGERWKDYAMVVAYSDGGDVSSDELIDLTLQRAPRSGPWDRCVRKESLEKKTYKEFELSPDDMVRFGVRSIVESHLSAAKRRVHATLLRAPGSVIVAGGAASNADIVQFVANVFQAPTVVFDSSAFTAALGAARALDNVPMSHNAKGKTVLPQPHEAVIDAAAAVAEGWAQRLWFVRQAGM